MTVSPRLRNYLATLMSLTYNYHRELDEIELEFLLENTGGSIRNRCYDIAHSCPEEKFAKLAERVINDALRRVRHEPIKSFIRALKICGFIVKENYLDDLLESVTVEYEPTLEPIAEGKEHVFSLLENLDLQEVKKTLESAAEMYVKGNYPQSLILSRQALKYFEKLVARKLGISDHKEVLRKLITGKRAREIISLINKTYYLGCKGHEPEVDPDEALFAYQLIIVEISYLIKKLLEILGCEETQ